jgi:hypothetical protein
MLGKGLLYISFNRSKLFFFPYYTIILLYVLLNSFYETAVAIVHAMKAFVGENEGEW